MRRIGALAFCLTLCAVPLTGCAAREQSSTIFAMDTVMELTAYADDRQCVDDAVSLIHDLEDKFSVTDEGSEIYALNENGSGAVSGDTAGLIVRALEICALTGGALDITVTPALRAWGFTTGEYRVPDGGELAELLKLVDYRGVQIDGRTVTLPPGAMLDLGAVAKGWTGDAVSALWRDMGVESGLLSLGGNVQAIGVKPNGGKWNIGIRDPFSEDALGAVAVEDKAVVTSGGYQRYFEENGVRYCHIIDPATGRPARSGLASVTVVGPEGVLCDGLSTAVFVLGLDAGAELWRENPGFEMVLVTDGGEVAITEGIEDAFTPMGSYSDAEIQVIRRG